MPLDLTLSPLYRINGQEPAAMPGLFTMTPPRKLARGREQDRLVVYLLLAGNATLSVVEYKRIAAEAANAFYQTSGALTSALRAGAESVNRTLLERNMSTSGRGQYVTGWLSLACLRDSQCTLSLSGPMHVFWLSQKEARHIYEPSLSGKGLGLSQAAGFQLSQAALQPNDQLLLCARVPAAWESALADSKPASLEATRRRLATLTREDLNAVLIQAAEGKGSLIILSGMPAKPVLSEVEASPEGETVNESIPDSAPSFPATGLARGFDPANMLPKASLPLNLPRPSTMDQPRGQQDKSSQTLDSAQLVQPSAYAISPQREEMPPGKSIPAPGIGMREFPKSIPRAKPQEPKSEPPAEENKPLVELGVKPEARRGPFDRLRATPSERARQTAKALADGMQTWRRVSGRMGEGLRRFLPRLLPGTDTGESFTVSTALMVFIAVLIPLLVVTAAFTVYSRYGRSIQYETALSQAEAARRQARSLTNPVEQRKAWENVLLNVEKAGSQRETSETEALRQEAEANLDELLGILRLPFTPAFSSPLGIEISRMAASDTDLFLLDAASGEVLHAELSNGRGFQIDTGFNCAPGVYGGYTVGPLVDILALPGLSSLKATMLGVDANGNLLYCEPDQVAQAIPLPPPDTNWGRITAFTLDAGNLYVLDAPARAVWVYVGKADTFLDRPYFFFGGQTPEKQDVIDLAVSGDDLYMLHADGHLSTCSYSRIETVPTRCQEPATPVNPFTAYQDTDLFAQAHFTQMLFTAPPDQSILLLDGDSQAIFRLTPRSLELQNQLRPATSASRPISNGPVGAMAVSPNHVLYLAVKGQVYFATGMP